MAAKRGRVDLMETNTQWVEVDLALLIRLLRLADAAEAWRTSDNVEDATGAAGRVYDQIGRLMAMCPTARSPLIKGLTPEQIRALVESSAAAERGAVN